MPATPYPTRYCSQCEYDWPQHRQYNLCPKCGRNTVAETSDVKPNETAATILAAKYREFEAWLETGQMASFEAALANTPTIGDPDDAQPDGA